ncbi:MAG: NHL repeat-containing protein, partial [Acidobacteriota bacterium]
MRKTVLRASSILLLLSTPAFVLAQRIETVDGVRVVHNKMGGEWGNNPKIAIQLVRTIGDMNTDDENLAFNMPGDMALDDAGNIYILDSGNHRIQKFSPEGKYLATFGRRGQGPGEFSFPRSFDLDTKGLIYVLDDAQKRIQVLTPEGKDQKIIPTTKLNLDRIRRLSSGYFVAKSYARFGLPGEPKDKTQPKLVKLLDADFNVIREFGKPFDFGDEMTNTIGNSFHFEVDSQDQILLSFFSQNRVEKYSAEGQLLWRADRELNYSTKLIEKGKQESKKTSGGGIS